MRFWSCLIKLFGIIISLVDALIILFFYHSGPPGKIKVELFVFQPSIGTLFLGKLITF